MGFGYVNFGEAELWSEVESFSGGSDSRTLSTKGKGTTLNVKYQNDKILGDIGGYIKAGIINWDANYVFDWQSPGYSYYLNSASSGTDLFAGVAGLYHISDDLYLNLSLDWYQMKLKVVEDEDDSYSVDQGFLMYALGVTYRF